MISVCCCPVRFCLSRVCERENELTNSWWVDWRWVGGWSMKREIANLISRHVAPFLDQDEPTRQSLSRNNQPGGFKRVRRPAQGEARAGPDAPRNCSGAWRLRGPFVPTINKRASARDARLAISASQVHCRGRPVRIRKTYCVCHEYFDLHGTLCIQILIAVL